MPSGPSAATPRSVPTTTTSTTRRMSDRWWETETQWFSWNVPERTHGRVDLLPVAAQRRPVQRRGLGVGRHGRVPVGAPVPRAATRACTCPTGPSATCATSPGPTGSRCARSSRSCRTRSGTPTRAHSSSTSASTRSIPPNPHPVGVVPFLKGTHFDQPGRVTGDDGPRGARRSPSTASPCATGRGGPAPPADPKPRPDGAREAIGVRHRLLLRHRGARRRLADLLGTRAGGRPRHVRVPPARRRVRPPARRPSRGSRSTAPPAGRRASRPWRSTTSAAASRCRATR